MRPSAKTSELNLNLGSVGSNIFGTVMVGSVMFAIVSRITSRGISCASDLS